MASMNDFRRVADDVRNWGRWGDDDELGTLNFITAEKVAEAASLVKHGKVFPLGVDFGSSGPQGAFQFRQNPMHVMTVDGGDAEHAARVRPEVAAEPGGRQLSGYFEDNPIRFNDDMIIMPLQAATQWDALSHVYYEDKLYNGFPANSVTSLGAFHCGIDKVDVKGITSRGVLLDVVRLRGVETFCELGDPITPAELDEAARRRASPSSAATSCWSEPVGGRGFWRPATAPSRAPAWTGRARRGCTTTRWRRSPPTT